MYIDGRHLQLQRHLYRVHHMIIALTESELARLVYAMRTIGLSHSDNDGAERLVRKLGHVYEVQKV